MNLTRNFTLEELTESETATRKGLDNTPSPEVLGRLQFLASGLQEVRDYLSSPMFITSGYRSPKVNSAVGGSSKSQHIKGEAADFKCPGYGDPKKVCQAIIESGIEFDQLINEGHWVHISFTEEPRLSVLTAHFKDGKVTYTNGL